MTPGKRKRKAAIALASVLAALALLLASFPVWFPWVLRPLARSQGANYSRYERHGYSRFVVHDVTYAHSGTAFKAKKIDALVPTVWLWYLARGGQPPNEVFARGQDCTVVSTPGSPPSGSNSVSTESRKANRTLAGLARWMPAAAISNGKLKTPAFELNFPTLLWSNGAIVGEVTPPGNVGGLFVKAKRASPAGYSLHAASSKLAAEAEFLIATNDAGLALQGSGVWFSNRVELKAQFGPEGQLPQAVSLAAEQFRVPAQSVGVPYYQELRGSVLVKWENGSFAVDIQSSADSPATKSNLPPFRLSLHARGNTNMAVIETAVLHSPAINAELSRELMLHFNGQPLRQPARLAVDADLSRLNWFDVKGRLQGEADLSPGPGVYPQAKLRLFGNQLAYGSWRARRVEFQGDFAWPDLQVSAATLSFDDGSTARISGQFDLDKSTVSQGHFAANGPVLKRWLPAGYDYSGLRAAVQFEGPWLNPVHTGELEISNATTPFLKPLDLHASWTGQQMELRQAHVKLSNADNLVGLDASLKASSNQLDVAITDLSLLTNGNALLALTHPAHLSANQPTPQAGLTLATSPLELSGPGGRVRLAGAVEWPRRGDLSVELEQVSSQIVTLLSNEELPRVKISKLDAKVNWSNGPALFNLGLLAEGALPGKLDGSPGFTLDLQAGGNGSGLIVSNLTVASQTSVVAKAQGILPVSILPMAKGPLLRIDTNTEMKLTAQVESKSVLWDELHRHTGARAGTPHLEADIRGSWNAPVGTIKVRAATVELGTNLLGRGIILQSLNAVIESDNQEARLTTGRFLLQGQPVHFAAQIPLSSLRADLQNKRWPDLNEARGRIQVQDAEIAAFAPLLPAFVAPQGDVSLELALYPGRKVRGQLRIADARTHPLGPTGPIRGIFLNLTFNDNVVKLERASGAVGGATLSVTGGVELGGREWLRGELPPFNVSVHGVGVPLARQPEFVIRGDLLLGVIKTNGAPPLISGTATLHDSYYLSDLQDLIPGKVASPEKRPPYFSIQDPLLSDWRLAIDVSGSRFLKLRSPLFNGEITSNLKLQGTLKDPIALGDLSIDSGLVRFPFASLQTQHGLVSLTSQDPFHPQLSIDANSKQFGYDIRMNVTGPADAPVIQFSSTPPLSSEQILLMVSAGELPQGTFSLTAQQRAQTVALFLGRDLLAKMGVGDEAQQRLNIKSGEQVSEQGRPTYQVEYKLSDRWSVTGEYDRFGDYNAGFKWRMYSK